MVRHLTRSQFADDYQARPDIADGDVTRLIPDAVREILNVAETWLGWEGAPVRREGNVWTPHKALRRAADHLLDHLAEIEARLAGLPSQPDAWHGRMVTTDADFARFTEIDLDEATSRLVRLGDCYQALLAGRAAADLDTRPDEGTWTLREVVHHVSGVTAYADMMGRLA
jgi:hypothetical protein